MDNGDHPDCFSETWRKARKAHTCCACREQIRKGDRYHYCSGVWDGQPDSFKHCARCWKVFRAIQCEAGQESGDVVLTLDCGHGWEDAFGEPPPDDIAALAFMTPDEAQAKL